MDGRASGGRPRGRRQAASLPADRRRPQDRGWAIRPVGHGHARAVSVFARRLRHEPEHAGGTPLRRFRRSGDDPRRRGGDGDLHRRAERMHADAGAERDDRPAGQGGIRRCRPRGEQDRDRAGRPVVLLRLLFLPVALERRQAHDQWQTARPSRRGSRPSAAARTTSTTSPSTKSMSEALSTRCRATATIRRRARRRRPTATSGPSSSYSPTARTRRCIASSPRSGGRECGS